jgi:hypothetical protein
VSSDDEPVPRIPRAAGRGFRPSMSQLLKIGITAGVLVMVIVVQRPCADSVSGFVTSFDNTGSQGSQGSQGSADVSIPKPGTIDPTPPPPASSTEVITTDMTEEQTRAAIERVRARAEAERAKRAGSGSAVPTPRSP